MVRKTKALRIRGRVVEAQEFVDWMTQNGPDGWAMDYMDHPLVGPILSDADRARDRAYALPG